MRSIVVSSTPILAASNVEILRIHFRGDLPRGSAGNELTAEMMEAARAVLKDHRPPAVLYDMTELEYRFGDSICELAFLDTELEKCIPAAVLANGETADALLPLFSPNWALGGTGMRLFREFDPAVGFLDAKLQERPE